MSKLADLEEALEALSSLVGERSFCELSPRELVATGKAVGGLRRRVDAVFAEWSAEMSRQSAPDLGSAGLARVEGFKTPEDMISTTAGVPAQEARKLVKVGTARAPQRDISGDVVPPRFPHLTTAMDQHLLSVENAHLILTMLEKVYVRADKAELMQVEKELVARAATLSPKDVRRLVAQAEALLDPRGVEHKLEHHRENRKLVITEYDGQLRIEFAADVVTGAPVKAAIEGIVTATLQRQAHRDEAPEDQRGPEDHRSAGQIRADALVEIATHALGCTQVPSKPTATVVVRMTLEQLHEGTGMATIDGTDLPVPVERARCLAAELQVIPMVLGGEVRDPRLRQGAQVVHPGPETRAHRARPWMRELRGTARTVHHPPPPVVVPRRNNRPVQRGTAVHVVPHHAAYQRVRHLRRRGRSRRAGVVDTTGIPRPLPNPTARRSTPLPPGRMTTARARRPRGERRGTEAGGQLAMSSRRRCSW